MNGVLSDLRDIGKRLDGKADAVEMERALQEKIDKVCASRTLFVNDLLFASAFLPQCSFRVVVDDRSESHPFGRT